MRYRLFGLTGLRVSELFLGAMTFGEQGGVGARPRSAHASWTPTLRRAATWSIPRSTTAAGRARRSSPTCCWGGGTGSCCPRYTPSPATGMIPTRPATSARTRGSREATWDRSRGWTGPVLLRGRHHVCAGGGVRCHQGPRGVSGAFVDFSCAHNSPRHSPSYRLTTLIAGIESMGVLATSAGRASGTRLVPAEPRYPGNGIAGTPSRRSS
jgi:hypothetical protein